MKELYIRRSVREFSEKEVSLELVNEIIKAGVMAPSARNQQAWEFIIVSDKALMNKISENASPLYGKANKVIVPCINKSKLLTPGMVTFDLGACIENMLLKATELKIGSCWIGTYPDPTRMQNLIDCLDIPEGIDPVCGIALGYPRNEEAFKEAERSAIIWHNKYNAWASRGRNR